MPDLFYGGCEINAFSKLLEDLGVRTVSISYMGLRRRIKHLAKITLADRFHPDTKILLDSGCHTINAAPDKQYGNPELQEIATEYDEFVQRNLDRIHRYTEFDAQQLGSEWIHGRRTAHEKEIVVWHDEEPLDVLLDHATHFPRIAVTGAALGDRDLTPTLTRLVREHSVELYGLGMSKPEQMAAIPWTGVTSTSWLSPAKFHDLIVWTGTELKRYPKKNRESGKRRHRTLIRDIGLDTDLIEDDDNTELLKLSAWSWLQQMAKLNGTTADVKIVANSSEPTDEPSAENMQGSVANKRNRVRNFDLSTNTQKPRAKRPLPGMSVTEKEESFTDPGGNRRTRKLQIVSSTSESLLTCTGCHMAGTCPEFDPGSDCAFEIPADANTPEERKAQMNYLINRQFRRTAFGLVTEEVAGGYPDSNVSREIGLYQKLLKSQHDMETEGFSLTIKANQSASASQAGAGVLSRIFGREPVAPSNTPELPPATPQRTAQEQMGLPVMDAEIIEEDAA
ncbi:hypothetical protein [Streptomyces sp. NPDC017448]|uniref:hypothetical protein n=1 Tax=Streptomyces sp. NPDC017448 TaxID=3364996 RepID=UPI0037ABEE73